MRILAIEIGDGELRAARALRTFGSARLAGVERIPFADASELRAALERLAAWHPQVVVALAPAALVTHRILTLPFGSRRRVGATLPLELLGQLPAAPEDPVIAFEPLARTEAGTVVLAAAARRAELEASIEPLVAAGLPPARVELAPIAVWSLMPDAAGDAAIVVADGERSALSVRRGGRIVGLRALGTPATEPVALAAEVRWVLAALGGGRRRCGAAADAPRGWDDRARDPARGLDPRAAEREPGPRPAHDRGRTARPPRARRELRHGGRAPPRPRERTVPERRDRRRDPRDGRRPRRRVPAACSAPRERSELVSDRVLAWLGGRSARERLFLVAAAATAVVT